MKSDGYYSMIIPGECGLCHSKIYAHFHPDCPSRWNNVVCPRCSCSDLSKMTGTTTCKHLVCLDCEAHFSFNSEGHSVLRECKK